MCWSPIQAPYEGGRHKQNQSFSLQCWHIWHIWHICCMWDLMVNPTQQIVAGRDCPSSLSKHWIAGQQCFCMCMSPYEPLCTTRLNWINIINRRTLSFSRYAFSAVHCCTVLCPFSPLPRPDHKDDPPARNTPWFLTCNGESLQSSWLHCWFLCAVN